jgi:hypothetical protein
MRENRIAKALRIIGILITFINLITSFFLLAYGPLFWVLGLIGGFVFGMCFIGFSEIIYLLQKNVNKQVEIAELLKIQITQLQK